MRHPILIALCIGGVVTLSACQKAADTDVDRALSSINVIDESNLNDLMLSASDPSEAVAYFRRTLADNPERVDLMRGLAKSLVRDRRPAEAVRVWNQVLASSEVTNTDRVNLADSLIRAGDWAEAEAELNRVPPTFETYRRYRLEAMVADANEEWEKADSFYEIAAGMTTTPSNVLNNWGFSRLTRGDFSGAERLFGESLSYDRTLFTAKNNLVMARAAQRKYDLPVIPMTQVERAQLLHTAALSAIKQGDISIGKTLLHEAVNTHPQHFEAAVRALRALENNVVN